MKIIIFGAGRVGKALLMALEGKKHNITVVDEDRKVCDDIAGETDANVICGDTSDPTLLEELKIGEADYVFVVTGSEETNFLVSMYAKHMNAKKVISRASEVKYSNLMERLGVEPLIPEHTLARELANMVLNPLISRMMDPSESSIQMVEKDVEKNMVDKTVDEVEKRHDFTIVSVYDGDKFLFPNQEFILDKKMKIVIVKHNV